jgi:UDP-N-acetyl-D-mannosaminuronate dehydrogenase
VTARLLHGESSMEERIAVIGLGYVGLNVQRVESSKRGVDATREVDEASLCATTLELTSDPPKVRPKLRFWSS